VGGLTPRRASSSLKTIREETDSERLPGCYGREPQHPSPFQEWPHDKYLSPVRQVPDKEVAVIRMTTARTESVSPPIRA
jgi:hypothetical protein